MSIVVDRKIKCIYFHLEINDLPCSRAHTSKRQNRTSITCKGQTCSTALQISKVLMHKIARTKIMRPNQVTQNVKSFYRQERKYMIECTDHTAA